jgi:LuxR family transcriptional regulator, maltose regulon positive regulatory protein
MPKAAMYTLVWSSERGMYDLYEQANRDHPLLQGGDALWFEWLANHTSFSFQGRYDQLNLLKEARPRGEGYWYAYRRQGKHVVKKYVGRSTDLTIAHLEAIAQALGAPADKTLPVPDAPLAVPSSLQSQAPMLASQLHLPRLHTSLIPRERLLAPLDAGLGHKLTLLSAPAGFGKTTLMSQWIANRSEHHHLPPFAWISLDATDNDPVRFWRYVITACQTFQADLGQSALELLSKTPQLPFKPPPLETALTMFLNALAQHMHSGILVWEDYHVITSPQIHEAVAFLLDHLPATLHLVIITRIDPPLPLARLRARNDLHELRAADLRFSPEEAVAFLQQVTTYSPSPETMEQLETRLEGWAAGLRLLALSLRKRVHQQEIEQAILTFAGSHRPLLEYFVTEVLNTQQEPIQTFLLQTSILSRLTGSLCNAVTSRDDSEQLLEAMDRANLFLEPLDEAGQWYRYHALFADAMEQEARHRLGEDALRELSYKASQWYEQHGMLSEAIGMALRTQDSERAAGLIEHLIETRYIHEVNEFHTLHRWLKQLPETTLKQHPALCFGYATTLSFIFAPTRPTPAALAQLEELLDLAEQGWHLEGNTPRLGEVFALRALAARQRGESAQSLMWARQALASLPTEELPWRSVSLNVVGIEELLSGQLDAGRKAILEAHALSEAVGNPYGTRATTNTLAGVYFEQGELHRAAACYRQVLAEARAQEDRDDIAHAQLGLAQLFYEWNELESAQQAAQEAFDLGQQLADEEFRTQAILVLARVEHARGESTSAQQRFAAFLSQMPPQSSPLLSRLFREVRVQYARLQLATGDLSAVQRWVSSRSHDDEALPSTQRAREELLVARWLLAQGKVEEALDILVVLLDAAQQEGRIHSMLENQVLMALAYVTRRQAQEARQMLQTALTMTYAEGYLRLFLDDGDAMAPLLRTLLPHVREKPLVAYIQTILRAFVQERAGQKTDLVSVPLDRGMPVETLSAQERKVLRLLAAGRSNAEIARELVVSVNTVRTQVQSIYRKLNVNNRVAASEMARYLRLL